MTAAGDGSVRVTHVVARMNVGGPAVVVSALAKGLRHEGYKTSLVCGRVGLGERDYFELVPPAGFPVVVLPPLQPAVHPRRDAAALRLLIRVLRRERPTILHTHTAKAGLLGRVAALAVRPRPLLVHTYHGHVLEGYFDVFRSTAFRVLEQLLARVTDALLVVSDATADDLSRLGVAPRNRFTTIRLGFDLQPFVDLTAADRVDARRELGVSTSDIVLLFAGRLVPIKRIDRLIEAVRICRERALPITLAIAGEGPLRRDLERQAANGGVDRVVRFLGLRDDLPRLCAAADVAVLASQNEGTPVFLIEAAAAAVPAVATAVGGVPDVVVDGATGWLVPNGAVEALATVLTRVAIDSGQRRYAGQKARDHVVRTFSEQRMILETARVYAAVTTSARPVTALAGGDR